MSIPPKYLSRKFVLTGFFTLVGTIAMFFGKLTADYVALATLVIGVYGASNVAAKKAAPED